MEDFYGLNAKGTDGELTAEAADRMKIYKMMLGMKEKSCTCDGKVFPKAPCDVFRAPNPARTRAIESQWTGVSDAYFTGYMAQNPTASADFMARNPAQHPPSSGPRFGKVNHLTPKGAGGCPDNPGNLQPHDLLCGACKMIDDQFGEWQGNNPDWRQAWNQAFRQSGIKRRTIANFIPSHW